MCLKWYRNESNLSMGISLMHRNVCIWYRNESFISMGISLKLTFTSNVFTEPLDRVISNSIDGSRTRFNVLDTRGGGGTNVQDRQSYLLDIVTSTLHLSESKCGSLIACSVNDSSNLGRLLITK